MLEVIGNKYQKGISKENSVFFKGSSKVYSKKFIARFPNLNTV